MPAAKTKPRPVGRPKLHDRAKSTTVLVRLNAADRKRLENAAEAKGLTISDWIREAIHANL